MLHRLAIMSKDGDWVLREDKDALDHVLAILAGHRARYRFGAPLDVRWLSGGWSAHLEYAQNGLRLRTDFVTRPPRLSGVTRTRMWQQADASGRDVVALEPLAVMKMTRREKDYAVIGELARQMEDVRSQLRYSRSSRDLIRLAADHPDVLAAVQPERPLLALVTQGRETLDEALDRERRTLIRADEARMAAYRAAAQAWADTWPSVSREIAGLPLPDAHRIVARRAEGVLPFVPSAEGADD